MDSHGAREPRPHRIPDAEGQELFQALRRALASEQPLDLLVSVGSLLASIDERDHDATRALGGPSLADLVLSFVDTPYAETTAALHALRVLVPSLPHAERVDAELTERAEAVPDWLARADRAAADPTWTITEVGGDAVDHLIGVRLPGGGSLTAAVILSRGAEPDVLDAVVLPLAVDDVVGQARAQAGDAIAAERIDPAAAAAAVSGAVDRSASQDPRVVTATWPLCRPVVEWMVRLAAQGTPHA